MLVMKANNVFVLCVAALSLSACASASASGPGYLQTVSTAAIAGDQSELIIYRPSRFTFGANTSNIEVNGMPTCDLPQGRFFRKNVSPGTTTIATSLFGVPGTSRSSFKTEAGKRYTVRVSPDRAKAMAGALLGIVGTLGAAAVSGRVGPFQIDLIQEEMAATELALSKMAKCP